MRIMMRLRTPLVCPGRNNRIWLVRTLWWWVTQPDRKLLSEGSQNSLLNRPRQVWWGRVDHKPPFTSTPPSSTVSTQRFGFPPGGVSVCDLTALAHGAVSDMGEVGTGLQDAAGLPVLLSVTPAWLWLRDHERQRSASLLHCLTVKNNSARGRGQIIPHEQWGWSSCGGLPQNAPDGSGVFNLVVDQCVLFCWGLWQRLINALVLHSFGGYFIVIIIFIFYIFFFLSISCFFFCAFKLSQTL